MPYFAVMLVLEDKLSHFLGSYTALSETQKEEETEYMYIVYAFALNPHENTT